MFVLNVSYTQAPAAVEPHIASHGAWVKKYLEAGVIVAAGPKQSGLGGVLLVQTMEREALRRILAEDSYVIADVAEYQVIELAFKATTESLQALKAL